MGRELCNLPYPYCEDNACWICNIMLLFCTQSDSEPVAIDQSGTEWINFCEDLQKSEMEERRLHR